MAVFDFTLKITRFGTAERAHGLVHAIAETLDRLGVDHLMADLHHDGCDVWKEIFVADPIVITGSTDAVGEFEERVRQAAAEYVPGAVVTIDWSGHDPARATVDAVNREIERVARVFGALSRGLVPARVRLAILAPDAYRAKFACSPGLDEHQLPAELTLNALYDAIGDAGADVGIDWSRDCDEAVEAFRQLRVLPPAHTRSPYSDYASGVDQWVAVNEAELAAADAIDAMFTEAEDHEALYDAVREALAEVPADVPLTGAVPGWERGPDPEAAGFGLPLERRQTADVDAEVALLGGPVRASRLVYLGTPGPAAGERPAESGKARHPAGRPDARGHRRGRA